MQSCHPQNFFVIGILNALSIDDNKDSRADVFQKLSISLFMAKEREVSYGTLFVGFSNLQGIGSSYLLFLP